MDWHTQQTSKTKNENAWSDFQSGPTVMTTPIPSQPGFNQQQWQYSVNDSQIGGLNPVPSNSGFGMGPSAMYGNMEGQQQEFGLNPNPQMFGQNPHPQMFGQNPHPQMAGQNPNPQMVGQVSNPQMFGQNPNPQMFGQNPHPQMAGQNPNPQMVGQVSNPQMFGQVPNPQMVGQTPNPQMVGQVPNPQMFGQVPNPQMVGQTPNPQLFGQVEQQIFGQTPSPQMLRHVPNPQMIGQVPQQQQQSLETPENKRKRIEREGKQKREAEITKRKLQSINISGGKTDGTVSLESLIGFNPETKTAPKPSPVPNTKSTCTQSPVQSSSSKLKPLSDNSRTNTTTETKLSSDQQREENGSKLKQLSKPDISYDELLTGTLMNLNKTVNNTVKKNDFKLHNSTTTTTTATSVFADSTKARQWGSTTDTNVSFEGLFVQPMQIIETPPTATPTSFMEYTVTDDSFGEFRSTTQPIPSIRPDQQLYNPNITHTSYPHTNSPQTIHTYDPVMMTEATSQTIKETLPFWVVSKTYPLPHEYINTLKMCSNERDSDIIDTNTLFSILMSSNIERSVLKDLWNEVNRTIPGTLTRNELICLLALIGLIQGGKLSVTMADITGLMVPPPVSLTTEPTSSQVIIDKPQPQQDDFGDFQGSDVTSLPKQSSILPTISHTHLPADSDPYSAFKSINESSTHLANNQELDDPYGAFKTNTSSSVSLESDPYSAVRALTTTNSDTIELSTTIEGVVLANQPLSTHSIMSTSSTHMPLLPSNDMGVVSNTPISNSDQVSTTNNGWAEFASFQPNTSDTFGDFSGFTGTADAPPLNPSPFVPAATPPLNTFPSVTPPLNPSPFVPSVTPPLNSFQSVTPPLNPSSIPLIPTTAIVEPSSGIPILDKKYTVKKVEHFEVWRTCLVHCDELLEQCVSVLCNNTVDQSLLEEIVTNESSKEYLRDILEVYRFAKRVHFSSRGPGRKFMTPERSQSLMSIVMSIKKKWNKLCGTLPNDIMSSLSDSHSSSSTATKENTKCSLCLLPNIISISSLVTIDGYNEQYSLLMNKDCPGNGLSFHCQCMDFWVKALDRDLTAIP